MKSILIGILIGYFIGLTSCLYQIILKESKERKTIQEILEKERKQK